MCALFLLVSWHHNEFACQGKERLVLLGFWDSIKAITSVVHSVILHWMLQFSVWSFTEYFLPHACWLFLLHVNAMWRTDNQDGIVLSINERIFCQCIDLSHNCSLCWWFLNIDCLQACYSVAYWLLSLQRLCCQDMQEIRPWESGFNVQMYVWVLYESTVLS
jgi:hypothetical protein